LPKEIDLPRMYDFFQKEASSAGLVLKNESFTAGAIQKEGPALRENGFNLEVVGSYAALKNFLASMEKSARVIEVERISFSSPEKKESVFSFSLSVKFYSY